MSDKEHPGSKVPPKKTPWELELHEQESYKPNLYFTRVPGGWLYESYISDDAGTSVAFVPFIRESDSTTQIEGVNRND